MKKIRILLIEDSEDDALLVLHQIKKGGYQLEYERIETAGEMRKALSTKEWDIVLSDYIMPHFNGLNALMILKESGLDIPFIIISGTIGEELAVEAMRSGAHDYLMKNNLQRLLPAIERELRDSKSRTEQKSSEKQIALLNFSLDHVNEAALLCNEQGYFLYINYEACRMLGYSQEELLKAGITDIVAEPLFKVNWQKYIRNLRTNGSLTLETKHKTRDGDIIPAEIHFSRFEYEGGAYILAMSRNISERKRAEEELQRLNRELRAISNCNLTLLHVDDEQTLLNRICRIICDEAGYRMAWVGFAEDDGEKIVQPVAWAGIENGYLTETKISWGNEDAGNGLVGTAIKSGKNIYVHNFAESNEFGPWLESALKHDYHSGFALPLKDGNNHVFGVLMIYSSEVKTITSDELRLMEEMAGDLAFGIINLRNRAERKRAEAALIISEERFSKIFRLSPVAMAIFKASNDRIVDVNDVFVNRIGYSREEIIGNTTNQLQLYADTEERNTILQLLHENGEVNNYECKIRDKAGIVGIGLNTTIEITLSGEKHYLASILDITERKQAENELRKLSRAVEQSPASVIITDISGNIEYTNPKFTQITGYQPTEVLGKNPRFLKSGRIEPETYRQLWQNITSGKEWNGEFLNRKKDGELYWEQVSVSPIFDLQGNISHFLSIKEDITLRKHTEAELIKAKEKAEESDRLKTSFLCNMSHEIRTPMNAIIGFAGALIEKEHSAEKTKEYLRIIRDRTFDLLRIVEDILDISKIEVGQLRIIESNVNLETLLNEIYEFYLLKSTTQQNYTHLTIDLTIPNDLKNIRIETDPQRLKQILNNLIDNAFKFTKEGNIEFGCKNTGNGELLFFVKDNGIGIPEDKQEIIFDRFRQADDMITARKYGGTGLGLSIVKGLTTLMNGKVWLESKLNVGTTFYFTIPLKLALTDKQQVINRTVNSLELWHKKIILIVEDDTTNAKCIKEGLSGKGLQILNAYTGMEAFSIFKQHPEINLILMDIRLPDINGFNLTKMIKKVSPGTPIIAQTAYASPDDVKECLEAGCDFYIPKPINFQQLNILITKALLMKT